MMTEEKRSIHVIKDENLGVDREYVAVSRKAEVGETIYTLVDGDGYFVKGEYGVVHIVGTSDVRAKFESNYKNENWFISHGNYHVLEPTDIVHIDGERYRLEDRKAEVGEEVIAKNVDGKWPKLVSDVTASHRTAVSITKQLINDSWASVIDHGYYYVLTPIHDAEEPKESDVITVLANLGAEVAELKRKNEQFEQALGWNEMGPGYIPELRNGLSELKSVVSNYESEIGRMQAEINALHEDKVRLGEQLAKVAAGDPKALLFTAAELAQIIVSIKKAGL